MELKEFTKNSKIDVEKIAKLRSPDRLDILEKLQKKKPVVPEPHSTKLDMYAIKANRDRMEIPDELPTFGLLPLPVDEHECIGLFESKQNLYLITAHAYNKLNRRIKILEKQVEALSKKK